jgi:hypothetical protein
MSNIKRPMSNVKVKKKQQRTDKNPGYETRNPSSLRFRLRQGLRRDKSPRPALRFGKRNFIFLTRINTGFTRLIKNFIFLNERYK